MVRRIVQFAVLLASFAGVAAAAEERFVAATPRTAGGVLELRDEATVYSGEVRLKQICRWEEGAEGVMAPWGDLVVTRVTPGTGTTIVTLAELRATLRDAGMSLAAVRFAGPISCAVTRSGALEQPAVAVAAVPAVTPTPSVTPTTQGAPRGDVAVVTLRERLTRSLADRLQLPLEALQISFNVQDDKLLSLAEPQFRFSIEPRRARTLGAVSWDVTVVAEGVAGAAPQKAVIAGTARAWQDQLVAAKPISGRQIIRPDDVIEKRTLVDSLPDTPLLKRSEAVNQQAAMDLKPGAVLTSHLVEAVPLARPGQVVTVTVNSGAIRIRSVAKAVDEGTYGQTIRVRNEQTKEMYQVTLTGPQQAVMTAGGNG